MVEVVLRRHVVIVRRSLSVQNPLVTPNSRLDSFQKRA
jgi:hypothetical protein